MENREDELNACYGELDLSKFPLIFGVDILNMPEDEFNSTFDALAVEWVNFDLEQKEYFSNYITGL